MIEFLKGKKTYIIGALMFLIAAVNYLTGSLTFDQFLQTVSALMGLNGLAVMTIRAAIGKIK